MNTSLTATGGHRAGTTPEPDHDELVERATGLRDMLWEDAPDTDRERRLTDRSIEAVTQAGLLRLMSPRRLGGYESGSRTVLDVTTELGRGCTATSWVTGVLNSGNFVAGLFPGEARNDVWADDIDAATALVLVATSSTGERVHGGMRIRGKWGYGSGSLHCQWFALLVPIGEEREMHMALVPRSAVTVEDTWYVTGMRGTGTNTVVADDVFIPDHRVLAYTPLLEGERVGLHDDEWLYRSSLSGVLQVFLLGSMIGAARAALSVVLEKAPRRTIASSTYASQAESVPFQVDVAEASTMIDSAGFHAARIADVVDRAAFLRKPLDIPTRARMRMDAAHTAATCRRAVDLLMSAHGTSAFAETNPLQRIWRDVNVGSRHGGFGSDISQEVYGRAMLGLDPRETSYLL